MCNIIYRLLFFFFYIVLLDFFFYFLSFALRCYIGETIEPRWNYSINIINDKFLWYKIKENYYFNTDFPFNTVLHYFIGWVLNRLNKALSKGLNLQQSWKLEVNISIDSRIRKLKQGKILRMLEKTRWNGFFSYNPDYLNHSNIFLYIFR